MNIPAPQPQDAASQGHLTPLGAMYREARAIAKFASIDALHAWRDAAQDEFDSAPDRWSDVASPELRASTIELDQFNAAERLRAVTDELALRVRTVRARDDERGAEQSAWAELARAVREQTNLAAFFIAAGVDLRRAGRDPRRGGAEWAGSCPLCGGEDRFRVWDGPNGRAWCRQCRWSVDVIAAARSLIAGCAEFRDAVRWLANQAGIPAPAAPTSLSLTPPKSTRRIATVEFVAGKAVAR